MKYDQYNEEEIVKAIIDNNRVAFRKLFLKYYEPLCNFGWRFTKSEAISEDLTQEVFADLWNLRQSLNPNKSIRLYLYQAVKNKALDHIDHQKVVRKFQENHRFENDYFVNQERSSPEDLDFIKAVRNAIDKLPYRSQQIYTLHREDGLTYREIAKILDISVKTVESQMSRALDILRNKLRDKLPAHITDKTIARIFQIKSATK